MPWRPAMGKKLVLKYSKDQKWLQPTRFGSAQLGVTGGLRLHTRVL